MKMIELTQDRVTMVDDEDFEMVSKSKWHCNGGYAVRTHEGTKLRLHRFLLGFVPGDGIQVDHINGDRLDNRRVNLRVCSNAENMRNRGKNVNNTSGFKGVVLMTDKSLKKPWQAQIMTDGKYRYLGVFATKEAAALAYNTAARELHGEFAKLNFETDLTIRNNNKTVKKDDSHI